MTEQDYAATDPVAETETEWAEEPMAVEDEIAIDSEDLPAVAPTENPETVRSATQFSATKITDTVRGSVDGRIYKFLNDDSYTARHDAPMMPPPPKEYAPHTSATKSPVRTILAKAIAIGHIIAGAFYFWYRISYTLGTFVPTNEEDASKRGEELPADQYAYQIIFLMAEMYAFIVGLFVFLEHWNPIEREATALSKLKVPVPETELPTVAVFVPTYKEPTAIVECTVRSALNIKYPKELLTVYLCDDGRMKQNAAMVEKLNSIGYDNLHYVIRDNNSHAKAGNLNNALQYTKSDLVLIFDADFRAHTDFLDKTLPYFYEYDYINDRMIFNTRVGFVQTPQLFFNVDQREDPMDCKATQFFEVICASRDGGNATACVGTNFIASRMALSDIGGFPTFSVTEDAAMGMLMQSKGYKGIYTGEYLAVGISPTTLSDVFRQRSRWCKGTFQMIFDRHNSPFVAKGLKMTQRLIYIGTGLTYSMAFLNVFFMATLGIFIFGQILPFVMNDMFEFALHIVPYLATHFLYDQVIGGFTKSSATSSQNTYVFSQMFMYYIMKNCITAATGLKLSFKVTNKAGDNSYWSVVKNNMRRVWFNVMVILYCGTVIVYGFVNPINTYTKSGERDEGGGLLMYVSICMAFYYMFPHIAALVVCFKPTHYQKPAIYWTSFLANMQKFFLMLVFVLIMFQGAVVFAESKATFVAPQKLFNAV
eukprot:Clim_evm4s173 gene=Clim_evmTU4s173